MHIKILVYIIDNQQIKHKISIPFSASWSFAVPVFDFCGLGGVRPKNGSPAGSISGRWSVPHNQSPYKNYFIIFESGPSRLLYLRYDKNTTYYE